MNTPTHDAQVPARPRCCSFCGRNASEVDAMVRSMRPHGEPAYICSDCVRKYTQQLQT